jgi:hypothetical protein
VFARIAKVSVLPRSGAEVQMHVFSWLCKASQKAILHGRRDVPTDRNVDSPEHKPSRREDAIAIAFRRMGRFVNKILAGNFSLPETIRAYISPS